MSLFLAAASLEPPPGEKSDTRHESIKLSLSLSDSPNEKNNILYNEKITFLKEK